MIEYFLLGVFGVGVGVFIGFMLCRRLITTAPRPPQQPQYRQQPQPQPPQPQPAQPQQQFQQPLPMPAPPAPPADDGFRPFGDVAKPAPKAEIVDTDKREVLYTTKGQPYVKMSDGRAKFIKKSEVDKWGGL